jgi:hypothetical protein
VLARFDRFILAARAACIELQPVRRISVKNQWPAAEPMFGFAFLPSGLSSGFGLSGSDYRVWTVGFGLSDLDCRVWTVDGQTNLGNFLKGRVN